MTTIPSRSLLHAELGSDGPHLRRPSADDEWARGVTGHTKQRAAAFQRDLALVLLQANPQSRFRIDLQDAAIRERDAAPLGATGFDDLSAEEQRQEDAEHGHGCGQGKTGYPAPARGARGA